jgi:hypothetical protein
MFSGKEKKCTQIYSYESGEVFSYSMDEDIIVKNEEPSFDSLEDLILKFAEKSLRTKSLDEKDFVSVNAALRYLNSTQTDFNAEIPHYKRLPEIVNPYDMEFGEDDGYDEEDESQFPGMDDDMSAGKQNKKHDDNDDDNDESFYNNDFKLNEDDLYGGGPGVSDDYDY